MAGLLRIALAPDATLVLSRTAPGRGAWICGHGSAACLERAGERGVSRALRATVEALQLAELHRQIVVQAALRAPDDALRAPGRTLRSVPKVPRSGSC